MITNRDILMAMSDEELAKYFVRPVTEEDYDEDEDGKLKKCGTLTFFGNPFTLQLCWSEEDAIDDIVEWFNEEYSKEDADW